MELSNFLFRPKYLGVFGIFIKHDQTLFESNYEYLSFTKSHL